MVNDRVAWAEFVSLPESMIAEMTPSKILQMYGDKFDDVHLEKAYALIDKVQGRADGKLTDVVSIEKRITQEAQASGILPIGKQPSTEQLNNFVKFQNVIQDRVNDFERTELAGKRKASGQEVKKIFDSVLLDKVFIDQWGSDPEVPVYQLDVKQQGKSYVKVGKEEVKLSSIPETQRALIINSLQKAGEPITETKIAEYWVRAGKPKG